jgi:hypothetical protein
VVTLWGAGLSSTFYFEIEPALCHNQTFEDQRFCSDQTKEANFICLYYYASADRQICGDINESTLNVNLHALRFPLVQTGRSVE